MEVSHRTNGFTLIELLVVVSIIGMLASITLVALTSAKDKSRIATGQTFHNGLYHRFGVDAILDMPLNEGSGNPKDQSINGYTGTLSGGTPPTWDITRPGMNGTKSLKFNGNDSTNDGSGILLPKIDAKVTNKMTISAWIYPTNLSTWYRYGIAGNGTDFGFQMSVSREGKLMCDFHTSSGNVEINSGVIQNNKWQQVACIYDGTNVYSIINGNEIDKSPLSGNLSQYTSARIGSHHPTGVSFKGYINDVKIYAAAP